MTETKLEVEAAFRAELNALLAKWGAELEAKDHYPGYPEEAEDVRMTVTVPGKWTNQGEMIREGTTIDLGQRIASGEDGLKQL